MLDAITLVQLHNPALFMPDAHFGGKIITSHPCQLFDWRFIWALIVISVKIAVGPVKGTNIVRAITAKRDKKSRRNDLRKSLNPPNLILKNLNVPNAKIQGGNCTVLLY